MSPGLRGDLAHEEYISDRKDGTAARRYWSPHRIVVDVELARPARLVVNQNAHRGWRSSVGTVAPADGLLAVDLPAGSHRVVLTFRDPLVLWGTALSALTVLALIGWEAGRWIGRRKKTERA